MNGEYSDECMVEYGMPQGSILGPLLFVVFINYMPDEFPDCCINLYANDTAITVTGHSREEVETKLCQKLEDASKWMEENVLTLNLKKTKGMVFGTRHTLSQLKNLVINARGVEIDIVKQMKYLGVILDSQLKFNDHVTYLKKKFISRIRMLGKLRPLVGQEMALSINLWYFQNLQRIQNYSMRVILQTSFEMRSAEMHNELDLCRLSDRTHIHTLNYTYMCVNGVAPARVCAQLTESKMCTTGIRGLRIDKILSFQTTILICHGRAFRYGAPIYWNLTDLSIRSATTVNSFKYALKSSDMFG